jgi:antitoxin (DNA-binding transcriptional repressor) of toxin-antitoxin stability system
MNISIAEAKIRLSELVRRAEAGEDIMRTRRGKIVACPAPPASEDLLPRTGA